MGFPLNPCSLCFCATEEVLQSASCLGDFKMDGSGCLDIVMQPTPNPQLQPFASGQDAPAYCYLHIPSQLDPWALFTSPSGEHTGNNGRSCSPVSLYQGCNTALVGYGHVRTSRHSL